MTLSERDGLLKLSFPELRQRLALAEAVLMDGVREVAGATAIKEVARQRDVIKQAIKDKKALEARKGKPEGVVIQMKPAGLKIRNPRG